MEHSQLQTALEQKTNQAVDNKQVFGVSLRVDKGDTIFQFAGAAGNLKTDSSYFIASTTKLFTSATIMRLRQNRQLHLDDPITKYLDGQLTQGLLVIQGVDYTREITVRQLLAHTSGLPDYFQHKRAGGSSLLDELTAGNDQAWTFDQVIAAAKTMPPAFKPGTRGKALYSDTNYQILGKIIEIITGKTYAAALAENIFIPLGLKRTYLYQDSRDTSPATIYFKTKPLPLPLAMTSFGPDGGIVSTSGELMIFVKAFFQGALFPKAYLDEMKQWNKIFFPLEYGVGLAKFKLPRIFSPFQAMPELWGHSGLSGAFAFYCPEKNVYLTGTVNQIHNPDRSFRLMLRLLGDF